MAWAISINQVTQSPHKGVGRRPLSGVLCCGALWSVDSLLGNTVYTVSVQEGIRLVME